jgi:uncharacterized membrane protein YdbT with pleckstrin-like domain
VGAMPYPKKLLNDYETLALDLHPHWWYFVEAAVALAGAVIFGIIVLAAGWAEPLKWLAVVLIVGCAIWLVARYIKWLTTNFVITSDRVIFRHGVFAKSGIEIPLERVNSVHFSQGVIERILGAGDLLIESGAEEGRQRFTDIRNPDQVQNLIHSQMEKNEDRMFGRSGSAAMTVDVATQLEKLEGMRDRGSLTHEEFENQKRKLLG